MTEFEINVISVFPYLPKVAAKILPVHTYLLGYVLLHYIRGCWRVSSHPLFHTLIPKSSLIPIMLVCLSCCMSVCEGAWRENECSPRGQRTFSTDLKFRAAVPDTLLPRMSRPFLICPFNDRNQKAILGIHLTAGCCC